MTLGWKEVDEVEGGGDPIGPKQRPIAPFVAMPGAPTTVLDVDSGSRLGFYCFGFRSQT